LYEKKKTMSQMHVSERFQKIIKNISKLIFEKYFCSYYYFCLEKRFASKNLSFQDQEKSLKSRFLHKLVIFKII